MQERMQSQRAGAKVIIEQIKDQVKLPKVQMLGLTACPVRIGKRSA